MIYLRVPGINCGYNSQNEIHDVLSACYSLHWHMCENRYRNWQIKYNFRAFVSSFPHDSIDQAVRFDTNIAEQSFRFRECADIYYAYARNQIPRMVVSRIYSNLSRSHKYEFIFFLPHTLSLSLSPIYLGVWPFHMSPDDDDILVVQCAIAQSHCMKCITLSYFEMYSVLFGETHFFLSRAHTNTYHRHWTAESRVVPPQHVSLLFRPSSPHNSMLSGL